MAFEPEIVGEVNRPKDSIKFPTLRKFVRIIVIDVRDGSGSKLQFEMEGFMDVPCSIYFGNVIVNWRFDELQHPMKGQAADVQAEGVNLIFPIMHPDNALAARSNRSLPFDEITGIFKKYHPYLKVTKER